MHLLSTNAELFREDELRNFFRWVDHDAEKKVSENGLCRRMGSLVVRPREMGGSWWIGLAALLVSAGEFEMDHLLVQFGLDP
jgi:hypothetical protein